MRSLANVAARRAHCLLFGSASRAMAFCMSSDTRLVDLADDAHGPLELPIAERMATSLSSASPSASPAGSQQRLTEGRVSLVPFRLPGEAHRPQLSTPRSARFDPAISITRNAQLSASPKAWGMEGFLTRTQGVAEGGDQIRPRTVPARLQCVRGERGDVATSQ